MDTLTDLAVRKAKVVRTLGADPGTHRRVRFTITDGHARIIEPGGSVSHEGPVASVEKSRNVTWVVTLESGEVWTVTRTGCNCGGGG